MNALGFGPLLQMVPGGYWRKGLGMIRDGYGRLWESATEITGRDKRKGKNRVPGKLREATERNTRVSLLQKCRAKRVLKKCPTRVYLVSLFGFVGSISFLVV